MRRCPIQAQWLAASPLFQVADAYPNRFRRRPDRPQSEEEVKPMPSATSITVPDILVEVSPRSSQSFDRPVFERQLGDAAEVASVAGDEDGTLTQRDGRDLQIL